MEKPKTPIQPKNISNKRLILTSVLISVGVAIILSGIVFGVNLLLLEDQDLSQQRKINSNQTKINQIQKDISSLQSSIDTMEKSELLEAVKDDFPSSIEEEDGDKDTDPTANWQEYSDEQYDYSLRLPNDWYEFTNENGFDFVKEFATENVQSPIELSAESGVWLTVKVEDSRGSTLETWADRTPYSPIGTTVESRKDTFTSNYTAIDQIENAKTLSGAGGGYSRVIYVINSESNQIYSLNFLVVSEKDLLNSQAIDLIISSLTLS